MCILLTDFPYEVSLAKIQQTNLMVPLKQGPVNFSFVANVITKYINLHHLIFSLNDSTINASA